MEFKLPTLKPKRVKDQFEGLPTFKWEEVTNKDEIGRGSYGSVLKGQLATQGKTVVVKRYFESMENSARNAAKEAKLLQSLDNNNIVKFIAVCQKPYALMMEFEFFDFVPFGGEMQVTNLLDFVSYINLGDSEAVDAFEPMFRKAVLDAAEGLAYLHSHNVCHRDLKPANILVSNKHYSSLDINSEMFQNSYAQDPVICKLTDFGESRSTLIQTCSILHARTTKVERGSRPYMAPEIVLEQSTPPSLTIENLKAIDVWALGMTIFNVINPDIQFPYELELKRRTNEKGSHSLVTQFEIVLRESLQMKRRPESSPQYHHYHATKWAPMEHVFEMCTENEAASRPKSEVVVQELKRADLTSNDEINIEIVPLGISQQTPLENFDKEFANALAQKREHVVSSEFPVNDGTDACTFLCFASAYRMWVAERSGVFQTTDWKLTVPAMFQQLVLSGMKEINDIKEKRCYDTLECMEVLKKGNLIPSSTEIFEACPESAPVFSPRGRQLLKKALQVEPEKACQFWIYTCEPYSFLIGTMGGDYFFLDTHPVSEGKDGMKTGIMKVYQGISDQSRQVVCQSIWTRLCEAGVRNAPQSISPICFPETRDDRNLRLAFDKEGTGSAESQRKGTLAQDSSRNSQGGDANRSPISVEPNAGIRRSPRKRKPVEDSNNNSQGGDANRSPISVEPNAGVRRSPRKRKPVEDSNNNSQGGDANRSPISVEPNAGVRRSPRKRKPVEDSNNNSQGGDANRSPISVEHNAGVRRSPRKRKPVEDSNHNSHVVDRTCSPITGEYDTGLTQSQIKQESTQDYEYNSECQSLSDEESNSDSENESSDVIEYYKDNSKMPVYSKQREVLAPYKVVKLLRSVGRSISVSKVCTQQPLHVEHHRTFLVDCEALKNKEDRKCDDVGRWVNNSNKKFRFIVHKDGDVSSLKTGQTIGSADEILTLKRVYFCLKDEILNDFRKRIDTIHGSDGQIHRYCLVQYSFQGGVEHPIELTPHGNCKSQTSTGYIRTWSSTKSFLKSASKDAKPRQVVYNTVTQELGGLSSCTSLGQLPRGRQQVKDYYRQRCTKGSVPVKNISGKGRQDDPWFRLLGDCKKQAKDRSSAFIRDVRVAPEPMCILTTDRQLNDMVRFCCDPAEFKPFTVDPTFDIGDYNVTPITYQHLILENRTDGKHPSMIGPVLVHEKKTAETYSIFSGTLKSLSPSLSNVLAFGTDGEKALVTAFRNNFEKSTNLLCELHLKSNVESKLQEFGISGKAKESIVADIFGRRRGSVFESGLADVPSRDVFVQQLGQLEDTWSALHDSGQKFFHWFYRQKSADFLNCVISPVRQRAGLGCPPDRFTTNRSERTNGVLQDFVLQESNGKKKVDEFTFAASVEKLVNIQQQEVELAVVGRGEYKLRDQFQYLKVSPSEWSKMREDQRKAALQKIHNVSIQEAQVSSVTNATNALQSGVHPIMKEILSLGIDWIPHDLLSFMVLKADCLVKDGNVVLSKNSDTVVVSSKSNPRNPHIVNVFANGKVECTNCPGFISLSICAHVVAACLATDRLNNFLQWLVSAKRNSGGVNLSAAVTYGMPKGRGRKGGRPPRKRPVANRNAPTTTVSRITIGCNSSNDGLQQPTASQAGQVLSHQASNLWSPVFNHDQSTTNQPFVLPGVTNQCGDANPVTTRWSSNQQPGFFVRPPSPSHMPHHFSSTQQPNFRFYVQPTSTPQVAGNQFSSANQQLYHDTQPPQRLNVPCFPSPSHGQFLVYLLQYCPAKTAVYFGCGNTLKLNDSILAPPGDLVIVSRMAREWSHQGNLYRKPANVYFHCLVSCIQRKQPGFDGRLCVIPLEVDSLLTVVHRQYLRSHLGI